MSNEPPQNRHPCGSVKEVVNITAAVFIAALFLHVSVYTVTVFKLLTVAGLIYGGLWLLTTRPDG